MEREQRKKLNISSNNELACLVIEMLYVPDRPDKDGYMSVCEKFKCSRHSKDWRNIEQIGLPFPLGIPWQMKQLLTWRENPSNYSNLQKVEAPSGRERTSASGAKGADLNWPSCHIINSLKIQIHLFYTCSKSHSI